VASPRNETGSRRRVLHHDDEFRQFAKASLPTLLRGAYLLLRDIDLAEDVVQATMLRVFRNWRNAREAPDAYSRKALISICRDHWRRQHRLPPELLGEDVDAMEEEVPAFSHRLAEREAMTQALDRLQDVQREVLVLRFYFDFSVAQTAELLDIPEGTVKSATHRGLIELRELLETPTGDEGAS
jgi:RNA polymerase sigma-70 factor (sigma-E family)